MKIWHGVTMGVTGVVVGAVLPRPVTLQRTLTQAKAFLATLGRGTERTLHELTRTLEQVNELRASSGTRAHGRVPSGSTGRVISTLAVTMGAVAAPALIDWLMTRKGARRGTRS